MKKRIDILLAEKGLCKSREKAKTQIIAGNVYAAGRQIRTASELFDESVEIVVRQDECPFVSRGGTKLQRAFLEFELNVEEKVCLDIGASTGGFTDCMLQNGAAFVYAVDVGYGQFDWKLRNDTRVELHERTNARYLQPFEKEIDFVSVDVSFISLALIFPAIKNCGIKSNADVVTLIKPQFEAGKDKVGKKGVIKDSKVHIDVIFAVQKAAEQYGLYMKGLTYSPIKGPNGNIEYLAWFTMQETGRIDGEQIEQIVLQSHEILKV